MSSVRAIETGAWDEGRIEAHRAALASWRSLSPEEQAEELAARMRERAGPAPAFDPGRHRSITLLVLGCDYRGGPALECGCARTRICLAGKGRPIPGSDATDATDQDCRLCVSS
jgi:hypothetical protein